MTGMKLDRALVGSHVRKYFPPNKKLKFEGGYFTGTVVRVDRGLGYFVRYEDGDEEHLDHSNLLQLRHVDASSPGPQTPPATLPKATPAKQRSVSQAQAQARGGKQGPASADQKVTSFLQSRKRDAPRGTKRTAGKGQTGRGEGGKATSLDATQPREAAGTSALVDTDTARTGLEADICLPVQDFPEEVPGPSTPDAPQYTADAAQPSGVQVAQGGPSTKAPTEKNGRGRPAAGKAKAVGAVGAAAPELTDFERERAERIAANRKVMESLGIFGVASSLMKPVAAPAKSKVASFRARTDPDAPRRVSERQKGEPVRYTDLEYLDEIEGNLRGSGVKRKRVPAENRVARFETSGDHEAQWNMPQLYDADGRALPHNRSCHVCTQCVASWRGAFDPPLGCSTCQLIWCSRCLSNVFTDINIDCVNKFISHANQVGWSCFMCQGTCACLDSRWKNLPNKIDRHKRAGWVGVTGNHDPSCSKPEVMAAADDEKLGEVLGKVKV